MTILETFLILFESDASKVKKGAEKTESSVTGLNLKLASTEAIGDALGASFLGLARQAIAAFAGIYAIQKAIGGAMENAEFAKHLGESAEALGISTRELGAWSDAVKHIGGSAEGAIDSFKALSGSLAQIDATGHSRVKPFFDELGIQMEDAHGKIKPINELLLEMADKFQTLSKQESFGFGRKMQLDEGMIRLLQQGQTGVEQLIAQMHGLGDITDADALAAKQWDQALDDAEHAMRSFGLSITTEVFPELTSLSRWFQSDGPMIKQTIETIAVALTGLFIAGKWGAITSALTAIAGLLSTIAGYVAAFGAFETIWLGIQIAVGAIATIFGSWIVVIGLASAAIVQLYNHWEEFTDHFMKTIQPIEDFFQKIGNFFNGKHEISLGTKQMLDVDHNFQNAQDRLSTMQSIPLGAQNSQSIMNSGRNFSNTSHVSIDSITVQTNATNADDIAKHIGPAIKDELNRQFRQTINSTDNGLQS